jgi:hypothetical protein
MLRGTLRVVVNEQPGVSSQILGALAAEGIDIAAFDRQRPTLEDVFLQLVGHTRSEPAA